MIKSTEHAVEFLGNQITTVKDDDGTVYVPLKRLCEILGMNHEWQRAKIKEEELFEAKVLSVPGSGGRHRKMLCLPCAAIGDWVSTTAPNTLRPEIAEALTDLLEEPDKSLRADESQKATADPGMIEITPEQNRKEQAYNCLGNTSWFLDAFLIWVKEMIKYGDYFPRDHVRKASREEVQDFVRRTRCNVRLMQAAVDAGRHYQELDGGINKKG